MDQVFRKFYRDFFMRSSGFIPTAPLNQAYYPGDFFQIENGQTIVLGNIFLDLIGKEDVEIDRGIQLNPANWNFSDGASRTYVERADGEIRPGCGSAFLSFDSEASYYFSGKNPKSTKLLNWRALADQLIIKLTQTHYSFREVYVVTESVQMSAWSLVISGSDTGRLELAIEPGRSDAPFEADAAKQTIQAHDIEYYSRELGGMPSFFRAKKLVLREEMRDVLLSRQIEHIFHRARSIEKVGSLLGYDQSDIEIAQSPGAIGQKEPSLDLIEPDELNPNTAMRYFSWRDINLDDVERLFPYR